MLELLRIFPRYEFEKLEKRYKGNYYTKYFTGWQIELFFKWIKQNLKIKSFLGTTPNAVLSQIWVAMCYYLLFPARRAPFRGRDPDG